MAQEFFAAFGHDALGIIGEDKFINQADFDGVNLIAIQALIKKMEKLEAENANLHQPTATVEQLKAENQEIQQATSSLRLDIEAIKQQLNSQAKLTSNLN